MSQDVRPLVPGAPIERALAGGEVHAYQIALTAGEYLHVVVEQRGIDVIVTLFGPDGQKLTEVDSPNGTQGPEPVSLVAGASGDYRLEVGSLEKEAKPGRYEVKIEELRDATPQDRTRVAAERAFAEGEQLRVQGMAESLRKAIEKYEEALPLFRVLGDRQREADTLGSIGDVYDLLGEKRRVLDYLDQALQLWRALSDRGGEASALNKIGFAYSSLGENQRALDYLHQALPLWRALGDRGGEAYTLANIGFAHSLLGENQPAFDSLDQALLLWRSVHDLRGEAFTLGNIGAVYYGMGENQKALDYYGQSLRLWREVGECRGEAGMLNDIGLVHESSSEMQKALDSYGQALPLWRAIGDRYGEAVTLNNIGAIYDLLGEQQKALNYYDRALALRRTVGDRGGEAQTLNNIGVVYDSLGDNQKALEYLNQAMLLWRALGDPRGEAVALGNLGRVYDSLGEKQKALDYYGQTLVLTRAVGDRGRQARTLNNIGRVYAELGEKQKALDYCNQAIPLLRAVGDQTGEAETLFNLARVERDRGNLIKARAHIEAALDIIQSLRSKVISQELRTSYFASNQDYYEFYVDLLMRQHQREPDKGHDAAALQASERARARSLLEMLTEARADIRQGVDPTLLERERSLQQQLSAKSERLTRMLSGKHTEEQAAEARKEVETALTQFQEVQAQIRAKSPHYAALTQPQPLSLHEIQQQVLDEDTLLLEYALGGERSFLWAVTPTTIKSYELPKRAEIEAAARRVYDVLVARTDTLHPEAFATLSQMLLGPVAEQLGKKRLLIVSEGALQYVPFAALPKPVVSGQWSGSST